jgi:hypothetical protein
LKKILSCMIRALIFCFLFSLSCRLWAQEDDVDRSQKLEQMFEQAISHNEKLYDKVKNLTPEQKSKILEKIRKDGTFNLEQGEPPVDSNGKLMEGGIPSKIETLSDAMKVFVLTKQVQSEEEIKDQLMTLVADSYVETFLYHSPRLTNFLVKVQRDSHALPKAAEIISQRSKLTAMAIGFFVTFLISLIIKRIGDESDGIFTKIKRFFFRVAFINALRIGIVVYLFQTELTPLISLFRDTVLMA